MRLSFSLSTCNFNDDEPEFIPIADLALDPMFGGVIQHERKTQGLPEWIALVLGYLAGADDPS